MNKFVIPAGGLAVGVIAYLAGATGLGLALIGAAVLSLMIVPLTSADTSEARQESTGAWTEAASQLGLDGRSGTRRREATMRGTVEGVRVFARGFIGGETRIKARFNSGLRSLDIDPHSKKVVRLGDPGEVTTGDAAFDEVFRVRRETDHDQVTAWLTPARRRAILDLHTVVEIDEVEEDEIEARLRTADFSAVELVAAVQACARTAATLNAQSS